MQVPHKRRLAVARLWYEANSFTPYHPDLADFAAVEWAVGPAALAPHRGAATEMAAVADFAANRPDWEVEVIRAGSAVPSGPIRERVYEQFCEEVLTALGSGSFDALYLSLHGALLTEARLEPERELLQSLRAKLGECPMGASFDLHANLHPDIAGLLDFASGYRTYPHVDMKETAARVLRALAARAAGAPRLHGAIAKLDAVLPSQFMRTDAGPMAAAQAAARQIEQDPGIADASLFGGFAYGDSPAAGAAAMVFAVTQAKAEVAAALLAKELWTRRSAFRVQLPGPAEGLRLALASPPGLVAITDPGDNPLSGGIADTPGLFRALLALKPKVPTVFAFFADPAALAKAQQAGQGALLRLHLGGQQSSAFGAPVAVEARVLRLTDGRFVNVGPYEHGLAVSIGPSALLDVEGIQTIVTQACRAANDPAFFHLHGIDLDRTRLLCVKAKNHFRAAFAPLCSAIIDIDAPGPAAANLAALPFQHVSQQALRASES